MQTQGYKKGKKMQEAHMYTETPELKRSYGSLATMKNKIVQSDLSDTPQLYHLRCIKLEFYLFRL